MKFKTIDLCAGIGGIRRGFELTGYFENVAAAEIDKYACLTYQHLYNENAYHDVKDENFKTYLEHLSYDVLLSGFPCQTFSSVGLQKGFYDNNKGVIFSHISNIISRTRPKAVFLENVENLIRHQHGLTFNIILNVLEKQLNYKVIGVSYKDIPGMNDRVLIYDGKDFIRNSKDFGVPQNRPRTYIMAFDRNRYGDMLDVLPNYLPFENDLTLYNDLNDLLEMGAPARFYLSEGYLRTLENHRLREYLRGHGFGYRVVNESGIEHPIANTIMATGGSGKERNLVYDPQENLRGKYISTKASPLNDKCIRMMTPREWGKLQGFINYAFIDDNGNDNFSFPESVSITQQYKQFGNSVTIPVIKTMADFMIDCFRILGELPCE